MSIFDVIYKTLGHTHTGIYTAEDMGEYVSPRIGMELKRSYLSTLPSINIERSLETHKIFHTVNH